MQRNPNIPLISKCMIILMSHKKPSRKVDELINRSMTWHIIARSIKDTRYLAERSLRVDMAMTLAATRRFTLFIGRDPAPIEHWDARNFVAIRIWRAVVEWWFARASLERDRGRELAKEDAVFVFSAAGRCGYRCCCCRWVSTSLKSLQDVCWRSTYCLSS